MRLLLLLYHTVTLAQLSSAQSPIVPGAYILELTPTIDLSKHPFPVLNSHVEQFHNEATDIKYTVRYEFNNPDIFLGVSIQVTDTDMSDEEMRRLLSTIPRVINVAPVGIVETPQPAEEEDIEIPSTTRPLAFTDENKLSGPFTGGDLSSSLRMGGVDKLHELGVKGKGIKIGIIDSGVDYRHPALGGKFGPGHKIAGGAKFVNDFGMPSDGSDPLSTCQEGGHGTHVAGKAYLSL